MRPTAASRRKEQEQMRRTGRAKEGNVLEGVCIGADDQGVFYRGYGLVCEIDKARGFFVKTCFGPDRAYPACHVCSSGCFCMNLLQQSSWRTSFVGFFSFCMNLFPPLQVYVPIVVLTLEKLYETRFHGLAGENHPNG